MRKRKTLCVKQLPFAAPLYPAAGSRKTTKDATLIGINVSRSLDLHTLYDGRVLIRSGARNRPLSGDEVRDLAGSKHTVEYETENVPGAKLR